MPTTQPSVSTGNGSSGQKASTQKSSGSTGSNKPVTGQSSAMQHNFIARVEGTPKEFTEHSVAFAMNLAKKELMMLVEQSVTSPIREHVVIQDWIDNPKRVVTLEILDSQANTVDEIKFLDCVILDHAADFNYGNFAGVVHVLGISYDKIDLGSGKAHQAFASAMSIVGKP